MSPPPSPQAPKETPEKPNLSASFFKTALTALLAIANFKRTGSLTGPAENADEKARVRASSTSEPETVMIADLLDFAILHSTNNLARENIILKLEKAHKDPELSAAPTAIKTRVEMLDHARKGFSQSDRNPVARDVLKLGFPPGICRREATREFLEMQQLRTGGMKYNRYGY